MLRLIILNLLFTSSLWATEACQSTVNFEGNCEALFTAFEFDSENGTCVKVQGSGCDRKGGFGSEKECVRACASHKLLFERISDKTQEKLQ